MRFGNMDGLDFLCTVKLISVLMEVWFVIRLICLKINLNGVVTVSKCLDCLFVYLLLLKIKEGEGHREAQINNQHLPLCSVLGKQLSVVWPVGSGLPSVKTVLSVALCRGVVYEPLYIRRILSLVRLLGHR